jgi:hypothetical protein
MDGFRVRGARRILTDGIRDVNVLSKLEERGVCSGCLQVRELALVQVWRRSLSYRAVAWTNRRLCGECTAIVLDAVRPVVTQSPLWQF